ncbi:MAG: hypothetical protein MUO82_11720 [Candidatus Thermoplasmatota archaeon]|nr:hypothetical protein [Candidatus Thermoplasmatota archaeon]
MDKDNNSFIFYIWIMLIILFSYIIIMNGIDPIPVIGLGFIVWASCMTAIYNFFFKDNLKEWNELKKTHRNKLVTNILDNLKDLKFDYQYFEYTIHNLKTIDNKLYSYTKQHLKMYPYILEYLNGTTGLVNKLNESLQKIKEFVLDNIRKELGDDYKHGVSNTISSIIEYGIKEDIEWLTNRKNEIKNDGFYIDLSNSWNTHSHIANKKLDWEKISQFIPNFIKSKEFKDRYSNIQDIFDKLQLMKDNFNNNLNELSEELDRERKLKGKCDDCPSLWKI